VKKPAFLLAASIFAAAPTGARAAEPAPLPPPQVKEQKQEGYIVTLSLIGAVSPSFPGSRLMRPYPFPALNFREIGEAERFATPDDGFGLALVDAYGFRAGPVANFTFHRGQRDGLFGLHNIKLTHEVGGFVEATPSDNFRARLELRQGIDGHGGFVATLGADYHRGIGAFHVSAGPRLNFGDNRYASAYYSVTPWESLLNGRLQPYTAQGGFTAAGGMATVRYDFNEKTSATVYGGAQRLLGSVAGSPIPSNIGSRDQFSAGLAISRSFEVLFKPW